MSDPEVAAIVCARGGAGAGRLLTRLDAALLRTHLKPLVGYSDITWLHLALGRLGVASLHGPMVARELADGEAGYHRESLWHGLTGEGDPFASRPGPAPSPSCRGGPGDASWGVPVHPGRGRGHPVEPADWRRPHRPAHRGHRRASLSHREDAAAAAGVGGAGRGAGHRLRRDEGVHTGARGGLRAGGSSARGAGGAERPRGLRFAQWPHLRPERDPSAGARQSPGVHARARRASRSWRSGSRESPPLGGVRDGHGVAGRAPARERAPGERVGPERVPADVDPAGGAWGFRF